MPRCALLLEYDGTNYAGWQRQPNGVSVQELLENAVTRITSGLDESEIIRVVGSGRTDSGVHGFGQVAHADIPESCRIPVENLPKALNSSLPYDIRVRAAAWVNDDFHARFQAHRREYRYALRTRYSVFERHFSWYVRAPFDAGLLQEAADVFLGTHDFTTFSKLNPDTRSYVCSVEKSLWSEAESGVWHYFIAADRFVYGMVRSVVGAILDVAIRKRSPEELSKALAAKDRSQASPLAPPTGLVLWRVNYPDDPFANLY